MSTLSVMDLIAEALELPDTIAKVEELFAAAALTAEDARQSLADRTALLNTDETLIAGKNAEQRAAQVRLHTVAERAALRVADAAQGELRRAIAHHERRLQVLRVVIPVLGARSDGGAT